MNARYRLSHRTFSKGTVLFLALVAVAGTACEAPTDGPAGPPDVAFGKGKGGGGGPGGGDPSLSFTFNDALAGAEVVSDGRTDAFSAPAYVDGECNVWAKLNLGDAVLNLGGSIKGKNKAACGDPRVVRISGFPDGSTRDSEFMTVEGIETAGLTDAGFGVTGCAQNLRFDSTLGGDDVEVVTTATGWIVRSQPAPANRAVCLDANGNLKFGGPLEVDFEVEIEVVP